MNYFAHALPFLDQPYFLAGTAVPDWLSVADRPLRLRAQHAEAGRDLADPRMAELASGILQHFCDDAHFHATQAFAETSLALSASARDALAGETGWRPTLLGHLLLELLLDAVLIAEDPERLIQYYRVLDRLDADQINAAVNCITPRGTRRLAAFIDLFRRERLLWDYLEDDKIMVRLNQVLRRVGLDGLPSNFASMLPHARRLVADHKADLLIGLPAKSRKKAPLTKCG